MKITILGHVCIDKNTSESSSYVAAGSPAMFMNTILKQLPDNQVTIIAPYGADFLPYKNNMNLYPKDPLGEKTLQYENITKDGVRLQKAHNRTYADPVIIDTKIEYIIATSDIVLIAPLLPNYPPEYLRSLLTHTKPEAIKILLPQGYYRDFDSKNVVHVRQFHEAERILPLVNIIIASEQDHQDMEAIAKEWAKQYNITTIITLGHKGAVAITPETCIQLPTRIVSESEIVDSVGSGDIFSAGFAYRYQQTHDVKEAGRFANKLARQCLFYTPNNIKINYQALMSPK